MSLEPTNHSGSDAKFGDAREETLLRRVIKSNSSLVRRLADLSLTFCWVGNAAMLIAASAWVFFDGRSLSSFEFVQTDVALQSLRHPGEVIAKASSHRLWIIGGAAFAVMTLVQMFAGLFVGGPRFRSLRMWMAFVAIAACWLTFSASWPDLYALGQKRRVMPILPAAEALANKLEAHWPLQDGVSDEFGSYLAYPQGAATIVLPLQSATFPKTATRFMAVEYTPNHAIRFELGGEEGGVWLERRIDGSRPTSFKGGLETTYVVERQKLIAPQWYLVRYRATNGE